MVRPPGSAWQHRATQPDVPRATVASVDRLAAEVAELRTALAANTATSWAKIRFITLPQLQPLLIINFVGAFVGAIKAAENILVMTGGGPMMATRTIGLEIFFNAFLYLKFGYATALAWILGGLLIGFTLYQLRMLKSLRFSAAKA